MNTLLRLDSSARTTGSNSRELGERFVALWREAHPRGRVIERDLAAEPIPHLSNETIEGFYSPENSTAAGVRLSDELLAELEAADHLLITSPLYNLTLPSTLKSWFDYVVRPGRTFEMGAEGACGLLRGKGATVITVRGGVPMPGDEGEYQTEYLRAVLAFMGITSVEFVALEGTMLDEEAKRAALEAARRRVERCFPQRPPVAA